MSGFSKIGAAALAGLVSLLGVQASDAQLIGNDVDTSYTQPSNTLLMPYDATDGSESYLVVSNTAGISEGTAVDILAVSTHWTFWAEDGGYLGGAWACLELNATSVVDPRALPGGGDLSGNRGLAVVTAYATDETCAGGDALNYTLVDNALVGTYTLADIASNAAFGGDAVGLGLDVNDVMTMPGLPTGMVHQQDIQTFNPSTVDDSAVIFLSVAEMAGEGATANEIGPNSATINGMLTYYGTDYMVALPDVGMQASTFASMQPGGGLIPSAGAINSSGFLRVKYSDGAIGGSSGSFIYGVHGQAVGQYGGSSSLKYTYIWDVD